MDQAEERMQDPMYRCIDREMKTGISLVDKVHHDILQIISVCKGDIKQTNYLRELMKNLSKGTTKPLLSQGRMKLKNVFLHEDIVPKQWKKYAVPDSLSVGVWLVDLGQRMAQLHRIAGYVHSFSSSVAALVS